MYKETDPLDGLSKLQLDRYYSIYHRYQDDAATIVKLIKARGKNAWAPFLLKSDRVNNAEGNDKRYFEAGSDAFEIGVPVKKHDAIETICEIRNRYGFASFSNNITNKCLEEFYSLFIFEEGTFKFPDGEFRGVKPLFKVLA